MVKIKVIPAKQRLGRKEGKGNSERRMSESESVTRRCRESKTCLRTGEARRNIQTHKNWLF